MNEQQRSISMMNPSTDNAGAAAAGWGCDFLGAMSIGLQTPHRQDWDWETTSLCLPARHRHRRYDQSEDQKPRILLPSSLGSLPEGFPGGPMAHFGPSSSSSFEPAAFMYSDERPHMLGGSDVNVFDEVLKKEDELELWCGEYQRGARIGLNLGHRTYFSTEDAASVVTRMYRRTRAIPPAPRCQAEHCKADLSSAKHYHRRHKVCEYHSKATVVMTAGVQQRFCQQCSRFHVLAEFDEVKRSCRKRLADHNRRRRKPLSNASVPASSSFQAPICTNTTSTREMREASKRVKTEDGSPMSAIPLPRLTSSNSAVTKCYNKEDVRGGYDDDEHLNSRGGMAEHKGPDWAVKGQYYSGLELALPWLSRSPSHYAGEREEETTEPSSTHSSMDNTLRHHHAPLLSDKAHTVAFQPLTSREWMVGNDTATATGPDAHHKIFSIIDSRIASAEEQSHVSVARHADYLAYRQWLWDSKNDHSKFSHGFRCFVPCVFDDTPAL